MTKPILYGPGFSTYVRAARLALAEKEVPYDLREIDMFAGAHKEPENLARHPFGKVPYIKHGDVEQTIQGWGLVGLGDSQDLTVGIGTSRFVRCSKNWPEEILHSCL